MKKMSRIREVVKIALLCEGHSERAIMDRLLEHDALHFKQEDVLEEEAIKIRSAKSFQDKYLSKTMREKIIVYRIIDSPKEVFKLSGPYKEKVEQVVNVITSPEIEMLIIHAEDRYDTYAHSKMKPSEYVNNVLGIKRIKNYETVQRYFRDIEKLKSAIKTYHSHTKYKENTIYKVLMK